MFVLVLVQLTSSRIPRNLHLLFPHSTPPSPATSPGRRPVPEKGAAEAAKSLTKAPCRPADARAGRGWGERSKSV